MKPKETILYVPIDFVGDDERALDFSTKYVETLKEARQKISDSKLPIKLALKTTAIAKSQNGWGMSAWGLSNFNAGIAKLGKEGIDYFVEFWPSGPTRSMYGVLFDQGAIAAGFMSICTGDLDQFPPQQNLEKFVELNEKVKTNKSILGVGARNIPVVLSYNSENAYLRRIFEGIMNLTTLREGVVQVQNDGIVDSVYKVHGDLITGVYLSNLSHERINDFSDLLVRTARKNNFFGFEDEYFMAILASRKGGITGITFNSIQNPFESVDLSEEREKIIKKQIKSPLEKLVKSGVGSSILETTNLEYGGNGVLGRYYSKEQINEVCDYIKEVLA